MEAKRKVHRNSFLRGFKHDEQESLILIMLNSASMQNDACLLSQIWDMFDFTICADGGANRLYDGLKALDSSSRGKKDRDLDEVNTNLHVESHVPTHIHGDLDSIRPEVRAFYSNLGHVEIEEDPCQDTNDLQKCLKLATALFERKYIHGKAPVVANMTNVVTIETMDTLQPAMPTVVVFGAFGGRFDQQIASVHALHEYATRFHRMVLIGDGNCASLLEPNTMHRLELTAGGVEGPMCSLLPVGQRCESVHTKGLKWDLDGQALALGELCSSSNQVAKSNKTRRRMEVGVGTAEAEAAQAEGDTENEGDKVEKGENSTRGAGEAEEEEEEEEYVVEVRTTQPLLWCCDIDVSRLVGSKLVD